MISDGDSLYASSSRQLAPAGSTQSCGNYRVEQCLGRGSFGKVYKGVHQLTQQPVALKFIFKSALGTIRDVERVVGEIQCLESLVHPSVIALREVLTTDKGHVVLAMEFAGGGDLCRMVNDAGRLTEAVAGPLFAQILEGVAYCHRYGTPLSARRSFVRCPESVLFVFICAFALVCGCVQP
jgi:serine/threonine protein kinase